MSYQPPTTLTTDQPHTFSDRGHHMEGLETKKGEIGQSELAKGPQMR